MQQLNLKWLKKNVWHKTGAQILNLAVSHKKELILPINWPRWFFIWLNTFSFIDIISFWMDFDSILDHTSYVAFLNFKQKNTISHLDVANFLELPVLSQRVNFNYRANQSRIAIFSVSSHCFVDMDVWILLESA